MQYKLMTIRKCIGLLAIIASLPAQAEYGTMDFSGSGPADQSQWHRTEKMDLNLSLPNGENYNLMEGPPGSDLNQYGQYSTVPLGYKFTDMSFQHENSSGNQCIEVKVQNATRQIAIWATLGVDPYPNGIVPGTYIITSGWTPVLRMWLEGGTPTAELFGDLYFTATKTSENDAKATIDFKNILGASFKGCTTNSGKPWVAYIHSAIYTSATVPFNQ